MEWEYRCAELPIGEDFETALNKLGKQRWELVSAMQGVKRASALSPPQVLWSCVFKRRAAEVLTKEK